MLTRIFAVTLLSGSLLACSSGNKQADDPLLEEAARYHREATEIQAAIEPRIDRIDSLKNAVNALHQPGSERILATLDSLKGAFAEWEENLVEVPGMPHEHHHGGGHEHHHHADATLKDLPPAQMRDLQREMLTNIRQIRARLETVSKQAAVTP